MTPQEYFQNHSLNPEYIKSNFAVEWDDKKITIPIYGEDEKLIYCKYRHLTGDTKFTFDKGGHPALFPIYKILELDSVVLCEGEPDCMRLWQEGIPAVTATSGVKTFNSSLASKLKDKLVYICLDTDSAGQDEIEKYARVLTEAGANPLIVSFPDIFKDVSVFFTEGGTKEVFQKYLDEAISFEEWEVLHRPEEWKLESGTELMSKILPPEEWLIDKVLPAEGFVFFSGMPSSGKSFYTLTLANSVVTGDPWLGQFKVEKQTKVLFIDKENSPRRKQSRVAGLGMKKGIENLFWIKYPEHFQLADPKEEDGLSKFAKMLSKEVQRLDIGLIVIDSFADVMVGNENAVADTQAFFDALRILFPQKSFLVLHHENKPSQGVIRTSGDKMRGSSNIQAQIVGGFRAFKIPKTTHEFVIEQFKAGDTEMLKPFKVELVVKPKPYPHQDKTMVNEVKYLGEYYDEEGKADQAKGIIEDFFAENVTANRKEILDHCADCGVSQRTIETVLKEMVFDKKLEKIRDGKEIKYIAVTKKKDESEEIEEEKKEEQLPLQ